MLRKYWRRAVTPAIVMMIAATLTASCAVVALLGRLTDALRRDQESQ